MVTIFAFEIVMTRFGARGWVFWKGKALYLFSKIRGLAHHGSHFLPFQGFINHLPNTWLGSLVPALTVSLIKGCRYSRSENSYTSCTSSTKPIVRLGAADVSEERGNSFEEGALVSPMWRIRRHSSSVFLATSVDLFPVTNIATFVVVRQTPCHKLQ